MAHDGTKLFSMRIFNMSRSCILLKQFSNGVWTMPVISMPFEKDPMDYIGKILKQVSTGPDFEFISAVSMLDDMKVDKAGNEQHSIVYDLRYSGKVLPAPTEYDNKHFAVSKWHPKGALRKLEWYNYPLGAYIDAAEKEPCLR